MIPLTVVKSEDDGRTLACGECNACCFALQITELTVPKKMWSTCRHIGKVRDFGIGCRIYHDRPAECQSYECLYAAGYFTDNPAYRPDRLGLIFDFRELRGTPYVQVWELSRDRTKHPEVQDILGHLIAKVPLVIRRFGTPNIAFLAGSEETGTDFMEKYVAEWEKMTVEAKEQ